MKQILTSLKAFDIPRRRLLVILALAGLVMLLVLPTAYVKTATAGMRYDARTGDLAKVPKAPVAIVFGAGVTKEHQPTPYLKNRLDTAVALYEAGRVEKLLMTGDNSNEKYNEPEVMQRYAVEQGVKPADVVVDYAGFNTYDSCYRAKNVFDVEKAVLVTQGYHLPRAMVTCQGFGIASTGVAAQRKGRDWTLAYILREHLSTNKALVQLAFKPQPTVL